MRPHLLARCVVAPALLLGMLSCDRQVATQRLAIMRAGSQPVATPQARLILTPDAITLRAEGATLAQMNIDAQARASMRAASRCLDLPALTVPLSAHLRQQREVADARCAHASSHDAPTHCVDVTRAVVWVEARAETPSALIVRAIATAAQAEATEYALLVRAPDGALRALNVARALMRQRAVSARGQPGLRQREVIHGRPAPRQAHVCERPSQERVGHFLRCVARVEAHDMQDRGLRSRDQGYL